MNKLKNDIIKYVSLLSAFLILNTLLVCLFCAYCEKISLIVVVIILLALIVSISMVLLFSIRLTKKISSLVNSINPINPNDNKVYVEFEPLLHKMSLRNSEITKQIKEIGIQHEKQDAMRRDFTANVSHELKTPLTSISGYAEIIKNGIAKTEDVERFAGKIYNESQRLVMLVGDIIKLSQLDSKEIPVKLEYIDLLEMCKAIISQLEIVAKKKNIEFVLLGEHEVIFAAEQIVEEIIFNLCDNAVKYNRENGKVTIRINRCTNGIEVSVSDTGIGIPQDELERIFERFYRVDKSHSKEIGGTGLGLSIVKHGARYLGAEVSIESELNKGTTVKILFVKV